MTEENDQNQFLEAFAPILEEVKACLPKNHNTGEFLAFGPDSIPVKEAMKRGYLTRQQAESMALKDDDPSGLDTDGKALERSDVVHDLLAHLAEQMMELNKKKQEVIKEALDWLEDSSGLPVPDWKLKTMVQKFHEKTEHDWKRAMRDNGNRKRFRLEKASWGSFEGDALVKLREATETLQPTLKKIEATDWLIDQIVYRLYGLTEDEVEIVEGG